MASTTNVATGTAGAQAITGTVVLEGFSARETVGTAAAMVVLRDGTSSAGPARVFISLPLNGAQTLILPPLTFNTGIFVDRTGTGSSELVLYTE